MFGLPRLEARLGRLLSAAIVGLAVSGTASSEAAELKVVRFSEAVHFLG